MIWQNPRVWTVSEEEVARAMRPEEGTVMGDADVIREALRRSETFYAKSASEAFLALERLEALSRVHVTQASHDLLVAEGWLDPEQARALKDALDDWRDKAFEALETLRKANDNTDAVVRLVTFFSDRLVETWHSEEIGQDELSLNDWMGLTDEQYAIWAEHRDDWLLRLSEALGGVRGGGEQRA